MFLVILLPTMFGVAGLVIDGGLMMTDFRDLHQAADAAATAAAFDLRLGKSPGEAVETAISFVQDRHGFDEAEVIVNIPPESGPYAGEADHVEVILRYDYPSRLMSVLDGVFDRELRTRSVAGVRDVTSGAAVVVLDPRAGGRSIPRGQRILDQLRPAGHASRILFPIRCVRIPVGDSRFRRDDRSKSAHQTRHRADVSDRRHYQSCDLPCALASGAGHPRGM